MRLRWTLFLLSMISSGCKNPTIGSGRGIESPLEPGVSRVHVYAACDLTSDTAVPANPTAPRCALAPGKRFKVRSPVAMGAFLRVQLAEQVEGCALTEGYVPAQSVVIVEGAPAVAAAPAQTVSTPSGLSKPQQSGASTLSSKPGPAKAFLDVIAHAEGTRGRGNDGYNVMFTNKLFTSYADHPRRVICAGICSSAAGRYQFLDKTWDGVRRNQGFKDFTPPNQDKGGLYLARQRGVTGYEQRLTKGAFDTSIRKLGREWASLPGSPYGQPIKSMDELWKVYQQVLGK